MARAQALYNALRETNIATYQKAFPKVSMLVVEISIRMY